MKSRLMSITASVVLVVWSVVYSQENIDDRGAGTANHNYFVVNQSPDLQVLLGQVEQFHLNKCGDLMREGLYEYVIVELNYTLERFVNHPNALQLMVIVGKLANKRTLPITYFEKAIALYPNYALTHAQYGAYLVDIGQLEAGTGKLEHAIQMDSKLVAAYIWIVGAYQKSGKLQLAREASQKARELGYKGKIPGEPVSQ